MDRVEKSKRTTASIERERSSLKTKYYGRSIEKLGEKEGSSVKSWGKRVGGKREESTSRNTKRWSEEVRTCLENLAADFLAIWIRTISDWWLEQNSK